MQQRNLRIDPKPALRASAVSRRRKKQRLLLWAIGATAIAATYLYV
jgi:hypothetical protein